MRALRIVVIGAIGLAAITAAASATAQGYSGYGYANSYADGGAAGYGPLTQTAINECARAVQARLTGGYRYGYAGYADRGGARVLGVSGVDRWANGLLVRGLASSGRYGAYPYGPQPPVDLAWRCEVDFRGFVSEVSFQAPQPNYGYGNNGSPYYNDYSQYGYRRY
jgi:hypothetical protein